MLCRDDLRQRDGWKPKKAPEKVRLFEATQTTICERKEIFVAENENRDLNKPNQNQTGSNAGNPNNNHADQPQRAPRRRPMPRIILNCASVYFFAPALNKSGRTS